MTSMDWDEVKRLAADFQKAQLSFSLQKLSERNCIEIITKLTESKALEVIFTTDGKEYVTPQHLAKEIKDELYVHGGRINLVELARILKVDLTQVSKTASDVEKHDKGLKIILGQLIDKHYIAKISEEINDKLSQNGHINVADLTLHFDLPADFLQSLIEKGLGKTIFGSQDTQDPRIFYTNGFIARNKAIVRGCLTAITRPTPLTAILNLCGVPERIFFMILEDLHKLKQVPGVVTGKQGTNSIYVPTIYSKNQSEWVDNFYKQNGYLEYDALSRLGISSAQNFIKRHFPNENLTFLNTVAVGSAMIDQVDANIEETVATGSFLDIYPLLPSVFSSEDVKVLLNETIKKTKMAVRIFADTIIVSENFIQSQLKKFEALSQARAEEMVNSGKWLQKVAENKLKTKGVEIETKTDRKSERRKKAASGKAGGGNQGRETKTKSTKKKYQQNSRVQDADSDDEDVARASGKIDLELIKVEDVKRELGKDESLTENEDFVEELALYLQPNLNKHAQNVAEQLLQKSSTTNLNEIEDRLNVLATNIRIFDKGIKHLDKDSQLPLIKYLLKSLATDFVADIFKLAAQQNTLQCSNNLSTEAKQKLLLELPADVKNPLGNLQKSLAAATLDDFLSAVEPAMVGCCLVLRKFDKKKERPMILGHREALLEQLNSTQEPAVALHLATDILFTAATQGALHMSGRHVSSVLKFLQAHLEAETNTALLKYHDLVLKLLSSPDDESKVKARVALDEGFQDIKKVAQDYKKHLKSNKIVEQ